MKICKVCKLEKNDDECIKGKNICRLCSNIYHKNRYRKSVLLGVSKGFDTSDLYNDSDSTFKPKPPINKRLLSEILKDFTPMTFKTSPTAVITYDAGFEEDVVAILNSIPKEIRKTVRIKINGNNIEIY